MGQITQLLAPGDIHIGAILCKQLLAPGDIFKMMVELPEGSGVLLSIPCNFSNFCAHRVNPKRGDPANQNFFRRPRSNSGMVIKQFN